MKEDIANDIELSILNFFQNRIGFRKWWESMDDSLKAAIELNLIDCIDLTIKEKMRTE